MSLEQVVKDIENAFKTHPLVKDYAMAKIKEHAMDEARLYGNTRALMGELENIFVTDLVTYIGAPQLARKVIGLLIRKYGDVLLEKAMKVWVKNHFEELCVP